MYKSTEPTYMKLTLKDLKLANYQRKPDAKKVKKISENFNPITIGTLIVSYRGGEFYLVDGDHRMLVLIKRGIHEWMCEVHSGLSYQDEANMFRIINKNRKPMSANVSLNAALEGNDPDAIGLQKIITEEGYELCLKNHTSERYKIRAVGDLEIIYNTYGENGLRKVLRFIKNTWGGEKDALRGMVMRGIAVFFSHYYGVVDENNLTKKLSITPVQELMRKAAANTRVFGGHAGTNFARAMVEIYNKGKKNKIEQVI